MYWSHKMIFFLLAGLLLFSIYFLYVKPSLQLEESFSSFRFRSHLQNQMTNGSFTSKDVRLEGVTWCPKIPPNLGPRVVNLRKNVSFLNITLENPDVQNGGRSKPQICRAQQKIAIIIPFRNREPHLKIWLYHMHPFLQKQQGDYGIYVVEQIENTIFNRAKLMNVGFVEAVKDDNYTCFIFSDVDIIPIDERNLYRCSKNPKHMANSVDKFSYSLPYSTLFGGVVAFTKEQFLKINGFSNRFWGWGGEDDELYNRVVSAGMKVERPNQNIARSRMIVHTRDVGNEKTGKSSHLIYKAAQHMYTDGLNSLKYDIIRNTKHQLYTKITVDIGSSEKMKKAFYFFNALISD